MERKGVEQGKEIETQVALAVSPFLASKGFDLVLVEYVPRGRLLRLYVDHEKGVSLDDCASLSRMLSDLLDAEGVSDEIPGRYTLEVSSPGLDRPLTRPSDFRRFIGSRVCVTTLAPIFGKRKFVGDLAAANEAEIEIRFDNRAQAIRYTEIDKARLVPVWPSA
jgi:ribosome maturation factor RimP